MPNFSRVSCKSQVTIASSGDDYFYEKMQQVLLFASTTESPLLVKKWLDDQQESILSYTAIILIFDNIVTTHSEEVLSASIEHIVPLLTGTKENPTSLQKILLCKDTNLPIVSSFCEAYTLDIDSLRNNVSGITFWSILGQTKTNRSESLCMNGQIYYQ